MPSYLKTVRAIMLFIAICAVHCYMPYSRHYPKMENWAVQSAAFQRKTARVPVYLYKQAGDYLPENREIRGKFDRATIASSPYLATKITMEPMKYFDLDAAILYWDAMIIPSKICGMKFSSNRNKGMFEEPVKTPDDVNKYIDRNLSLARFIYMEDEIMMVRHKLEGRALLVGIVIGPWTMFHYMCGGKDEARVFLNDHKNAATKLMEWLSKALLHVVLLLIENGVQAIQWTETHLNDLTSEQFSKFYMPHPKKWVADAKSKTERIPFMFYVDRCHDCLKLIAKSEFDVVAVDETIEPRWIRSHFSLLDKPVTIQGNFDPNLLLNPPEKVRELTMEMVRKFGKQNYIANLGSHIWQKNVSIESVKAFVDAVHDTFN